IDARGHPAVGRAAGGHATRRRRDNRRPVRRGPRPCRPGLRAWVWARAARSGGDRARDAPRSAARVSARSRPRVRDAALRPARPRGAPRASGSRLPRGRACAPGRQCPAHGRQRVRRRRLDRRALGRPQPRTRRRDPRAAWLGRGLAECAPSVVARRRQGVPAPGRESRRRGTSVRLSRALRGARQLLASSGGLVRLRGRWVELDRERLREVLSHWERVRREAEKGGLSFLEGMRLLAGAPRTPEDAAALATTEGWSRVEAGAWLARTLEELRGPTGLAQTDPGPDFRGTLRPYQKVGVAWLAFASSLRLGVCLADDMGLGKTIQVLALLLLHKRRERAAGPPHLLVAPASLLANWKAEIDRFAPSLTTLVAHPSAMAPRELAELAGAELGSTDLVITTYGTLARVAALRVREWSRLIRDDDQAVKNPGARHTDAVKTLKARSRIALTGTPVENRLGDLWSLYDFLDPGLLGSAHEFPAFAKRLADRPDDSYAPLRRLIGPCLLSRP